MVLINEEEIVFREIIIRALFLMLSKDAIINISSILNIENCSLIAKNIINNCIELNKKDKEKQITLNLYN